MLINIGEKSKDNQVILVSNTTTLSNSPKVDPIGYTANTVFQDVKYVMQIQRGEIGPLFVVNDQESKKVFTGTSCTDVWSQICSERLLPRVNGVQVRKMVLWS